jgi:hypothetical protein
MKILSERPDPFLPAIRRQGAPIVESYFLKLNEPSRREALWIKFTFLLPERGRGPRASVWTVHFDAATGRHRALKRTWPLDEVSFSDDRLDLGFGECALTPGRTAGRIADDEGEVRWDLRFEDRSEPLMLYPPVLMRTPVPRFKHTSPMPDAVFRGRFSVDGAERSADGARGMLGHNWGPRHTRTYAWAHANLFEGDHHDAVFEGACASLRVGPFDTPLLTTLTLRHAGRVHDLRAVARLLRRRSSLGRYRWSFSGEEPPVRIEGVVQTVKDDIVGLYYDNPDGTMTYCLNSKIAHLRLFLYEKGCPDVVLDSRSAAFELGTSDPHHGATMAV